MMRKTVPHVCHCTRSLLISLSFHSVIWETISPMISPESAWKRPFLSYGALYFCNVQYIHVVKPLYHRVFTVLSGTILPRFTFHFLTLCNYTMNFLNWLIKYIISCTYTVGSSGKSSTIKAPTVDLLWWASTILISRYLKVHKIENFFGSEFEFYTISLLVMLKY